MLGSFLDSVSFSLTRVNHEENKVFLRPFTHMSMLHISVKVCVSMCTCVYTTHVPSNVQVSDFKPLLLSHPQHLPLEQPSSFQKKTVSHNCSCHHLHGQCLTTTILLSVSVNLITLSASYQWNGSTSVCLCMLISLSVSVHVAACVRISALSETAQYPIVYVYIFLYLFC